MIHFYTHFDQHYQAQAAVMIESLLKFASEEIRIGCLWLGPEGSLISDFGYFPWQDDNTISVITLKTMAAIHGDKLLNAKADRPWREFCWTLEPALIDAALMRDTSCDMKPVDLSVYVDADSLFFNDPIRPIRDCFWSEPAIGLTPHYFPKGKEDKARTVGRYNFGFGVFNHMALTRKIVRWWFEKSLGKWGPGENDQTFLDSPPSMMIDQLVDLPRGMNVGPWQEVEVKEFDVETKTIPNLGQREVPRSGVSIKGTADRQYSTLISYHFHEFRRIIPGELQGRNPVEVTFGDFWNRTNYPIHPTAIEHIYKPYEEALAKWI